MINYVAFGHFLENPTEYKIWFCGNIFDGKEICSFDSFEKSNEFMINNGWILAHNDEASDFRVDYWIIKIKDFKND